jgi:hypothetical protein
MVEHTFVHLLHRPLKCSYLLTVFVKKLVQIAAQVALPFKLLFVRDHGLGTRLTVMFNSYTSDPPQPALQLDGEGEYWGFVSGPNAMNR